MKTSYHTYLFILCIFIAIGDCIGQTKATPSQLLQDCQSLDALTISRNIQKLQQFPKSAFDNNARQQIKKLLQDNPPHQDKLIKLAGFLNMNEALFGLLSQEKISKKDKRSIKLALVRTGDEAKLLNLMKNVKKIPIGDEFNYEVLPILIYVRQKMVTDYLLDIVLSDEKKCTPADAETAGNINCAYRIIEGLAPIINNFPYTVDDYGDLETDDYNKVLPKVRKWIMKNKANYTLNTEIY